MIVFFSATAAALIMNALIAWFAYKAIAEMSARATERMNSIRQSGVARKWLQTLETASAQAAEVTTKAKADINNFEPTLRRAEIKLTSALIKIDKSCDTASSVTLRTMDRADKIASKGYWIIDKLYSGARAASSFVRLARER